MNQHLKALHIRFLPDQTQEDNLSSREFLKKADFVNIKTLLSNGSEEAQAPSNGGGGLTPNPSSTGEGNGNTGGNGGGGGDDDAPNEN